MKPRITFLMHDLCSGGAQRHTIDLIIGLHEYYEFSVVIQKPFIDKGITGEATNYTICQSLQDECNLNHFERWNAACLRIADTRPDLVICINQFAMLVGMLGKLRGIINCPVTTIFHSTQVGNIAGWLRTLPYIPAVRLSDGLFYISENQRRIWQGRGLSARNVWTIRNGIDITRLDKPDPEIRRLIRSNYGLADSDFVIGCLAVFRYEKNHLQQIDALSKLRAQGIPAKLMLVGDGPMREQIESKIANLNMMDHVILTGMQNQVAKFITAMDISWITSLSIETLSIAALECMTLGVPMIMSDIGGASEIIEHGKNGYLYPAGDNESLINCVKCLIDSNHKSKLAEAAKRTVLENFTCDKMLDQYSLAFTHLLNTNTTP